MNGLGRIQNRRAIGSKQDGALKEVYIIFVGVSKTKGLVHTPIQSPTQKRCFEQISSPLGHKIPQPNWISDQLATPWLHNSEVQKGRQTPVLSRGLSGTSLTSIPFADGFPNKRNCASSADHCQKHPPQKKQQGIIGCKKRMSYLQCFVTFGKPQFCATFGEPLKQLKCHMAEAKMQRP